MVDTLQSGTNSSIDCHVSKDGKRLWNLSENGEVMCFDLRMMKAVNAFEDMFGATSLGLSIKMHFYAYLNAYFSGKQQRNSILHRFIIWFDKYLWWILPKSRCWRSFVTDQNIKKSSRADYSSALQSMRRNCALCLRTSGRTDKVISCKFT